MQHTLRTLARILVVAVLGIGHIASSPTQCLALPPSPTNTPSQPQNPLQPTDEVVTFRDNRLIVKVNAVPLEKILAIVTRETGVAFYLQGSAETPVTADFETGDLEVGIKLLIRGLNSVFYYGPSQPGVKAIRLTSVLIIANSDNRRITAFRPSNVDENPGEASAAMPYEKLVEDIDRLSETALTEDRSLYEIAELAEFEENQERRLAAVEALGDVGNPEAESALLKAMSDDDFEVRAAAVEALGSVSGKEATDYLVQALGDENADVRTVAVETLAFVGGKDATDILIRTMQDEDAQVRAAAVEALADIGDKRAAEVLIKALDDADEEVQEYAKAATVQMGIKKNAPKKRYE